MLCVWVLDVFFLLLLHDAKCHIVLYCEWEKNNRVREIKWFAIPSVHFKANFILINEEF